MPDKGYQHSLQGHGLTHSLGALAVFVGVIASSWLYGKCAQCLPVLGKVPGDVRGAAAGAILFMAGREFKDLADKGYWDWEGSYIPWAFTVVLAAVWSCAVNRFRGTGNYEPLDDKNPAVGFKPVCGEKGGGLA